jgi:nucleotide-binding universal stress UspA family protein
MARRPIVNARTAERTVAMAKKPKKKVKEKSAPASEIVVAVDGSDPSRAAVLWATRESMLRGIPLKLVHIVAAPSVTRSLMPVPVAAEQLRDTRAREIVEDAANLVRNTAQAAGVSAAMAGTEIYYSSAIPTLIELSERATMVVIGSRGHGALRRGLLGSVSTGLVSGAHCPVAVIHEGVAPAATAPVVVGIDGSPSSDVATRIAFEEAAIRGVELIAVHAWSDVDMVDVVDVAGVDWDTVTQGKVKFLDKRLSGWCERYPDISVRRVVVRNQPAIHLAEEAEKAQLLVVGSRGRGGFAGLLLGSVSSMLAHYVRIPLIVAHGS